jgi:hypothetical protein
LQTTPFGPLGVAHTIAQTAPIPLPGSKHRFWSGKPQQSPFAVQVPISPTHPPLPPALPALPPAPLPPAPPVPPLPLQIVEGAHAIDPFGCPLVVSSAQHPVVQSAFDVQSGAQVPVPVPKFTQCAAAG